MFAIMLPKSWQFHATCYVVGDHIFFVEVAFIGFWLFFECFNICLFSDETANSIHTLTCITFHGSVTYSNDGRMWSGWL